MARLWEGEVLNKQELAYIFYNTVIEIYIPTADGIGGGRGAVNTGK